MSEECEFDRTGYTVVRGFLNEELLEQFIYIFENQTRAENRNYITRRVPPIGLELFSKIFEERRDELMRDTAYNCDLVVWGDYFSISDGMNAPWHQDHETYFYWQNHFDSFNFYIPIIKPDRKKSNLSILPYDRFFNELPEIAKQRFGKGASMLTKNIQGQWAIYDEENSVLSDPVQLDSIERASITPELNAGDLLLLRGDVYHKTQDTDTDRVSISIRAVSSKSMITRKKLLSGGASKLCYLTEAREGYTKVLDLFDSSGKSELDSETLLNETRSMANCANRLPSQEEFLKRILADRSLPERNMLKYQMKLLQTFDSRDQVREIVSLIEGII